MSDDLEGVGADVEWVPGIYREVPKVARNAATKAGIAMGRAGITDKAWLAAGAIQNEFDLTVRQRKIVAQLIKVNRNKELARRGAAGKPEPGLSISHWGMVG